MTNTTKYLFEKIALGTTGWNLILSNDLDLIDGFVNTYLRYQVASGESLVLGDPLCIQNELFYKAQAGTEKTPCVAVAIESGTSGEYLRGKRCGELTGPWSFTGSGEIYLGNGVLTQTPPGSPQMVGASIASAKIVIML